MILFNKNYLFTFFQKMLFVKTHTKLDLLNGELVCDKITHIIQFHVLNDSILMSFWSYAIRTPSREWTS